ncbi:MAG: hypothetical protein IPN84_15305 [Sphingomonadales bacterium]|nr:hypothetical protein [Sphingomonadales bacterium]
MRKLNDQILERLGSGSTFARDDLQLDANYDSVGRVLNMLVKERKVVRVGRGRYRLASGNAPVSAASISEQIERRIARSKRNVFLRGDFGDFGSYDAVGRALRQMTNSGRLIQIGYGLYAKAEVSPFSGKSAPLVGIKRLAAEALGRLGKAVEPSSFERSYNAGRSTQVPTGRTLAVKDRVRRRIGYDGNYVVLERT